MMLSS
jgi:hypothetical protein